MSVKNLDRHNRWRNKTVAFRVSPDEDREIETAVRLSGLTKMCIRDRNHVLFGCFLSENPPTFSGVEPEKIYENTEVI